MYFEVWVDQMEKEKVRRRLMEICEEVHEVFYDYDFIVKFSGKEEKLMIDGVKKVRRHYTC